MASSNFLDKLFGIHAEPLEKEFKLLFESNFDGVLVLDDERKIIEANVPMLSFLGIQKDDLAGKRLDHFMCPGFRDLEAIWNNLRKTGQLGGGICLARPDGFRSNFEYRARFDFVKGYHFWIFHSTTLEQAVARKAQEDANKLSETNKFLEETKIALLNALEDFSEEKQLLEQEKRKVEAIIASIGDAVFVTDVSGHIRLMNPVAEVFSGISADEALGYHYTKIFRFATEENPKAEFPDFVAEVIKSKQVREMSGHVLLIRSNGDQLPVSDSAAPIVDTDGQMLGCVVVVRDFSRERKLEQAKDEFLSVAAHQLRTPLGALRWGMELLLSGDMGPLSDRARLSLTGYHDNVLRMINLVNDLLDVSRIDQARIKDNPEPVDLENIFQQQLEMIRAESEKKKVNLKLLPLQEKLPIISIDRARLTQVIENLLSNAVKYNRQDGVVEVKLSPTPTGVQFTVRDTGIGIPSLALPRIFSKFFRAENAVISDTEGSGLGLFVVKSYIKAWGGTIKIDSLEGKGTTVTVDLPLKPKPLPIIKPGAIPRATPGI